MKKETEIKFEERLLVKISGEISPERLVEIRPQIQKKLESEDLFEVELDFSDAHATDDDDDLVVGLVLGVYKKANKNKNDDEKIKISILNPSKQLDKTFNLSGVYSLVPKKIVDGKQSEETESEESIVNKL